MIWSSRLDRGSFLGLLALVSAGFFFDRRTAKARIATRAKSTIVKIGPDATFELFSLESVETHFENFRSKTSMTYFPRG